MSNDKYNELVQFLGERFGKVDNDLAVVKKDLSSLKTSVDLIAKGHKDVIDETISANGRLDRHEEWMEKAAEKVGIEFGS